MNGKILSDYQRALRFNGVYTELGCASCMKNTDWNFLLAFPENVELNPLRTHVHRILLIGYHTFHIIRGVFIQYGSQIWEGEH